MKLSVLGAFVVKVFFFFIRRREEHVEAQGETFVSEEPKFTITRLGSAIDYYTEKGKGL